MKVTKKLLSLWLALVMVVSLLPTTVLAAELEAYDGIEAVEVLPDEAILTDDAESAPESGAEEAAEPEEAAPVEEIALAQEMPTLDAAGDEAVVVIAGSDFQDPGGDSAGAKNVTAILTAMKVKHPTANGLIFCGDYDKKLPDRDILSSINALKSAVKDVYDSDLDEFFVQGNHDQVAQGSNGLTGPGAHDTEDYGMYIIDEDDYQWSSGANEKTIKATAAKLQTYLTEKVNAGYTKPIFVASHVPLHFTPRTQEGDGKYAKYIFDVLQSAGESGLHIIFLYGHDHSQGWDNYLGGAAVYLAVGDNINIAVLGSGTTYTKNELKFTYMNAGFTGYYADWEPDTDINNTDSGVDKTKTMTVFTITDDKVKIERYDANGVHDLKSEGKQNVMHSDDRTNPPLNTTVYRSPQYIALGNGGTSDIEMTDLTDSASDIRVTAKGTGLTVTAASTEATYGNIEKYVAYDIEVADFVTGSEAKVWIPMKHCLTMPMHSSMISTWMPSASITRHREKRFPKKHICRIRKASRSLSSCATIC